MLRHVLIENYRGLKRLELQGLSRVNLFVGKNNSGKTSVLEAMQLAESDDPICELTRSAWRRSEAPAQVAKPRNNQEMEIRHFFLDRDISPGSSFRIYTDDMSIPALEITLRESAELIEQAKSESESSTVVKQIVSPRNFSSALLKCPYILEISSPTGECLRVGLNDQKCFDSRFTQPTRFSGGQENVVTFFVSTASLANVELARIWDAIALEPEEELIYRALRIIEPELERIAFLSGRNGYREQGVVVKLKGHKERIPLGSFGEGLRRILVLAFALVKSAGGILLIDEIDTGLHYSIMSQVWEVLIRTAKELDVQVFATTHSQDCIDGLADVLLQHQELHEEVSLQRVEQGVEKAVNYTAEEIILASRQHIEVR